jgi:RNA polymerase sigma factor for flagellar operon FliA
MARRTPFDVTPHLGLVERIARHMGRRLPPHVDVEDLISAGTIGLVDAAARYDRTRNDSFEAFATFRIRGAILDELRSRENVSRQARAIGREIAEAARRLETQLARAPEADEIARELGIELDELYARQSKLSGMSVVGFDDAGPDMHEMIADDRAPDAFAIAAHREEVAELVARIKELPLRTQQILSMYYLDDMNLEEIGEVFGVTTSRICKIHGDAIRWLRERYGVAA